jgi:pyruvate dehydrogenase E2 component (dihydrolipoamide acetyltransferase)
MHEVHMPRLSLGDETVTIASWLKNPGDPIERGMPLVEVETDKATMEVESPFDGVLAAVLEEPGAVVAAGGLIAYVAEPGETIEAGRLRPVAAEPRQGPAVASRATSRPELVEHGELAGLPPARAVDATGADEAMLAGPFTERPLSRQRAAIARRLAPAALIPQFAVTRDLRIARGARGGLTVSDLLLAAVVATLKEHRALNAWLVDDVLLEFEHVNVAFAVDTPDGVVAPVVRAAELLPVDALAARRSDLVARARERRLGYAELAGATFTVSNIGGLGADSVVPIVTPPLVAALGVGRSRPGEEADVLTGTVVGDHRALDGADGARFLAAVADKLAPGAVS